MSGLPKGIGCDREPATELEHELLEAASDIEDIWVAVGQRIGVEALVQIMGELGGLVVSVPTRAQFMRRLYAPRLDAEIIALWRRERLSDKAIARRMGISADRVRRARCRALKTRPHGR